MTALPRYLLSPPRLVGAAAVGGLAGGYSGLSAASVMPTGRSFMHVLGIHGDPIATRHGQRSPLQRRNRASLGIQNPYGYGRAFGYTPWTRKTTEWAEIHARRFHPGCTVLRSDRWRRKHSIRS